MDPGQPGQMPRGRKRRVDTLLIQSWGHVLLEVTRGPSLVLLGIKAGLQSPLTPFSAAHCVLRHLFLPAQMLQDKIPLGTTRFPFVHPNAPDASCSFKKAKKKKII